MGYRGRAWRDFAALSAAVVTVGLLGYLQQYEVVGWVDGFHPDGESNLFASFSGALLVAAALNAFTLARLVPQRVGWLLAVAAGLFGLAIDEVVRLHERAESILGIDWQLLYLPVGAIAAACYLSLVPLLRDLEAHRWFFAVPPAWLTAQFLEFLQWRNHVLIHPGLVVPEETLEMLGSALLVVALRKAVRSCRRQVGAGGAAPR